MAKALPTVLGTGIESSILIMRNKRSDRISTCMLPSEENGKENMGIGGEGGSLGTPLGVCAYSTGLWWLGCEWCGLWYAWTRGGWLSSGCLNLDVGE